MLLKYITFNSPYIFLLNDCNIYIKYHNYFYPNLME
nr:MAG TPA: hypothetical protein [Caudoviricetes sp.]